MKITVDTNVLVRAAIADDPGQARVARATLKNADLVAVPNVAICEFAWVLRRVYGVALADVGTSIRALIAGANIKIDRPAIEAGLEMLEAGGDFADGVIAYEGASLGAETFASFDKAAVSRLKQTRQSALLLA